MAMLPEVFRPSEVEPAQSFDLLPAGKYVAIITESEMRETAAGTGQYLKLTFQVIDGQYKGRLLWTNLNLINPNETAVNIARKDLSAIARAVNLGDFQDSGELHNKPLEITVKIKPAQGQYDAGNEIKGYAAIGGSVPMMPTPARTPTPAPTPAPAASNWLPS